MSKEIIIGFLSASLMLATALLFNYVDEQATFLETGLILAFSFLLFIASWGVYSWFQLGVKRYRDFITKIEHSVDKLLDKQRFIDQGVLKIIERDANTIWVVTTKLGTELGDKEIEKSVENNLKDGKHYVYFLPHHDSQFSNTIDRNLLRFKKLNLYTNFSSQITFIRLPIDTQFLLEEVVIYNPEDDEHKNDNTKGLNGFTYYEAKEEVSDKNLTGSYEVSHYHMKLEGDLLTIFRDRLQTYLTNFGLHQSAQRVLSDFSKSFDQSQLEYLAKLLNYNRITDMKEHKNFLVSLKKNQQTKNISTQIEKILSHYGSNSD